MVSFRLLWNTLQDQWYSTVWGPRADIVIIRTAGVLVKPLYERLHVIVQDSTLLRFHCSKSGVAPSKRAALRLGVAAELVLAGILSAVAMWTLGAHANAKQTGEHDADVYSERLYGAQRVSCQDELSHLVVWLITISAVVIRLQRGLVFSYPWSLFRCMFWIE